eukprot:GEMP01100804.1.p1 GENE.GEMP01100804.1~~GEMP01100804.1.p1  ORF type:complete len:145 (-),score=3.23 GEMP01100804.1:77-511(-)
MLPLIPWFLSSFLYNTSGGTMRFSFVAQTKNRTRGPFVYTDVQTYIYIYIYIRVWGGVRSAFSQVKVCLRGGEGGTRSYADRAPVQLCRSMREASGSKKRTAYFLGTFRVACTATEGGCRVSWRGDICGSILPKKGHMVGWVWV